MGRDKKYIVFSDLDGTLLSAEDYSYQEAVEAIALLKRKGIPLVLTSSKTRAEIELYRTRLGNDHPFIVENGGAIYIPVGYYPFLPEDADAFQGYHLIELGTPYGELRRALKRIEQEAGVKIRGYGDMTPEEVAEETRLSLHEARLAMERDYDEPFRVLGDEEAEARVIAAIEAARLRWTKGDRYFHILGRSDKGQACQILCNLYRRNYGSIVTIGLGDSLNDLPLLARVDHPVLVKRPDGGYEPRVVLDNLIRAEGIGPDGFNRFLTSLIGD